MGLRIVVAEDEQDTREYLTELLTREGHEVVAVADGRQLVEVAEVHEPHLVITDLSMRGGPDGIKAAQAICRHRPVPVILVTAHHDEATLNRAASGPVTGYLLKPLRPGDLQVAITMAMARFNSRNIADLIVEMKRTVGQNILFVVVELTGGRRLTAWKDGRTTITYQDGRMEETRGDEAV